MNLKELRYQITARENLSGKLDRVTGASNRTSRALGTQNRHLSSLKKNISSAATQLPFFSNAMGLATNPILLATGAVAGFGIMLNKAENEAAAFNTEFRALYNLNLDKTPMGMANMKSRVFDTAFDNGFNARQTSTAYYDVQSVAGIQGSKAKSMIEKTGMFSRVMQSDFNGTIAGTAQVMDIYGMKVKDVDKYLESMFSTVMVGKTTFDEMSKVQVEYAAAAAAAGQGYTEANKIFAAFSKTTKSVEIAATMTKTAFQDLTKKSTLEAFSKLGVDVFDSKNQMLGVDEILRNLIPKLQGMDDQSFAKLKEEIGGSEGIKGLLDLSKTKADSLLASFDLFDNSGMDYGKAIRGFNKDATELNTTLVRNTKTLLAEIGQDLLPMWNKMKEMQNADLKKVREVTSGKISFFDQFMTNSAGFNVFAPLVGSTQRVNAIRSESASKKYGSKILEEELLKNPDVLGLDSLGYENRLDELGLKSKFYLSEADKNTGKEREKFMNRGLWAIQEVTDKFKKEYANRDLSSLVEDGNDATNPSATSIGGTTGADKTAALGAGGQKVINITIEKFQDEININGAAFTESNGEMVSQMEEGFLRVLQGVEEAYG